MISFVNPQDADVNRGGHGDAAENVLYQKNPVAFVESSKPMARVMVGPFWSVLSARTLGTLEVASASARMDPEPDA